MVSLGGGADRAVSSVRRLTALAFEWRWMLCALLLLSAVFDVRADEHATISEAYSHAQADEAFLRTQCSYTRGFRVIDWPPRGFMSQLECNSYPDHINPGGWTWNNGFTHDYPLAQACAEGEQYDHSLGRCVDWELECTARPEVVEQWAVDGEPGQDLVCHQGCTYGSYFDPSTGQSYYSSLDTANGGAAFGQCTVGEETPEPTDCNTSGCFPDADSDGVPDDSDAFPNDPTESTDSDGDGLGDNGDASPNDPDDGADDGTGNESDNTASGGGTCGGAPPVCSGDGILCNMLWQQYNARCALERVEGYARGIEEGVEDLVAMGPGGNGTSMEETNGILDGIKGGIEELSDWVRGVGDDPPDLTGPNLPEKVISPSQEFTSVLDSAGSCPAPVEAVIEFMGHAESISFSYQPTCDFLVFLKPLLLALGALLQAYIVSGLRR